MAVIRAPTGCVIPPRLPIPIPRGREIVSFWPNSEFDSSTSRSSARLCRDRTSRTPSEPFDHETGRTPESPARRVPQPTGLDRTSSSSQAPRPFLRARAQLAHIQPGTMGWRLKSLGPVRSVCVSV